MSRANINDPASVARLYPRDAYTRDAGRNSRGEAGVLHGVRVTSPPDQDGNFALAPASRHVGEDAAGGTPFLFPQLRDSAAALSQMAAYGAVGEHGDGAVEIGRDADAYDAFVRDVIDAARSARFQPDIGFREERLKGFHGG